MTVAVLPGSFDPITRGHVDIIERAARMFDKLVVAVYAHPKKNVLFSLEERKEMVRQSLADLSNVEVFDYEGLTVDIARRVGADVLVRGLRWVSDFEAEFQQATANRQLLPGLEVICLFASGERVFLSSSIIKDIVENGGDVDSMVPEPVARRLRERFPRRVASGQMREVQLSTS